MKTVILSTLLLSACTSVVPSTVMRLNNLSPLAADPAGFAIDLTLPAGIDVQPGTAQMIFAVKRSDTGQAAMGRFTLQRVGTVFRVAPADLTELRNLQATAGRWNARNDAATDGFISIGLAPCRIGDGPTADAQVSVGLQIVEGGAFLPLVRNGPLSAVASPAQIRDMGVCP